MPTIIVNLSLPNEQFYEICCQLNEGKQYLFNFIMHYYALYIFTKKNNELPSKPFQIFLGRGAGDGKSFLITAIIKYLKQVLRYPNQNLDHMFLWLHLLEKLLQVSLILHDILHCISPLSQDWNPRFQLHELVEILLNYLMGFQKVSKRIVMWFK